MAEAEGVPRSVQRTEFHYQFINHPLDIYLILRRIFEHLHNEELTKCRLVCKFWNSVALEQIQNYNRRNLSLLKFRNGSQVNQTMESFIDTFQSNPSNVPHSGYSFDTTYHLKLLKKFLEIFQCHVEHIRLAGEWGSKYWLRLCTQDILTILELHGKYLKHLTINIESIFESEDHLILIQRKNLLPNLKVLNLIIGKLIPRNVDNICILLKNLYENIPNNADVNMVLKWNECTSKYVNILFEDQRTDNLKDEERCLLKLKSLKICHSKKNRKVLHEMEKFLDTHKDTIEELQLSYKKFPFPSQMKSLKQLFIHYIDYDTRTQNINRKFKISYAACFPKLKSLEIKSTNNVAKLQFFSLFQPPCSSLKKLTIGEDDLSQKIMEQVSNLFPNVSILKIHPAFYKLNPKRKEIYQTIWNSERFALTLTELSLNVRDIINGLDSSTFQLDQLFSGGSLMEIIGILQEKSYNENHFDTLEYDSILKLKNLRFLAIDSGLIRHGWIDNCFSDVSGFCIFAKMMNLQYLFIQRPAHQFSASCIKELKKKMVLLSLDSPNEHRNEDSILVNESFRLT